MEETQHDGGPVLATPVRKGWAAAVVKNPYAGRYEDIMPMMEALKPLGIALSRRLLEALGGSEPSTPMARASIVGSAGEIEHGALWHVPGGYAMREILGRALAIVPSACKMGAIGASLDLPIHQKDALCPQPLRCHHLAVPDAPRADELLFVLAMTPGAPACPGRRPAAEDIAAWDGQR